MRRSGNVPPNRGGLASVACPSNNGWSQAMNRISSRDPKPPTGLEPVTSPLPRVCSTTELRWQVANAIGGIEPRNRSRETNPQPNKNRPETERNEECSECPCEGNPSPLSWSSASLSAASAENLPRGRCTHATLASPIKAVLGHMNTGLDPSRWRGRPGRRLNTGIQKPAAWNSRARRWHPNPGFSRSGLWNQGVVARWSRSVIRYPRSRTSSMSEKTVSGAIPPSMVRNSALSPM